MVIRLETAQWGGSSGGRAAGSGRIKLSFELTGVNFSGTHTGAHTAPGAVHTDHLGRFRRLWGAGGARPNVRGGKIKIDDPPLARGADVRYSAVSGRICVTLGSPWRH